MNNSARGGESRSEDGRNTWITRRSMRTAVLGWWERGCTAHGVAPGCCRTATARRFVDAVILEAEQPHRTGPDRIVRAARAWVAEVRGGDDIPATFQSVAALREVLSDSRSLLAFGWPAARVHRIFDTVMAEVATVISGNLYAVAFTDPLTGSGNRRGLDEDLPALVATAARTGKDLCVVVIDLDGLKTINDTDGHAAGDAALRRLVNACHECLRETDRLYRIGGDEFVAVLPFTDHQGASEVMDRAHAAGAPSFSWGAASLSMMDNLLGFPASKGVVDPGQLIAAADAELYAKRRAVRSGVTRPVPSHEGEVLAAVALTELASLCQPAAEDLAADEPTMVRSLASAPWHPSGADRSPNIISLDAASSHGMTGEEGIETDGQVSDGQVSDGRVVGRRLMAAVVGLAAAAAAFFALAGVLSPGGTSGNGVHQASSASQTSSGLSPYRLETGNGLGTTGSGLPGRLDRNGGGLSGISGIAGGIGLTGGSGFGQPGGGTSGTSVGSTGTASGGGGNGSGSGGAVNKTSGSGSGGGSSASSGSGGGSNSGGGNGSGPGGSGSLTGFLNGLLGNPTGALTDPTGTIQQALGAVTGTVTQATGTLPVPVTVTLPSLPVPVTTTLPPQPVPVPPVVAAPVSIPVAPPAAPVTLPPVTAPPTTLPPVTVPPLPITTTVPALPGL